MVDLPVVPPTLDPASAEDEAPATALTRRRMLLAAAGAAAWAGTSGCAPSADSPSDASTEAASASSADLPSELWQASARQLAAAIRDGRTTSLEVVEAHLARIEQVNAPVNALVAVYPDEARAAAEAADEAVAAGAELGPLHGVPFTIKDNLDQQGKPNTNGLEEQADQIATQDHPCVERMRAAGGVPIGRTNLPDMGLRVHSNSELWGRTLNPWSPEHNVGGSSGGEAAALAAGMTPIGLGNDIGGSLRNPANCCAIASLKPSLGRIPGTGGTISSQLMAVDGPMARTVGDVRLGYDILAGVHPRDPWTVPVPLDLPAESKRAAIVPEPAGGTTDPSVAEAVREAGRALEAAGWEVEEVQPPHLEQVFEAWFDFLGVELEGGIDFFRQVMAEENFRFLELVLRGEWQSRGLPMYAGSTQRRHELLVAWNEFFSNYPILVGPVFTQPPFEVGYDVAGETEAWDVLVQLRLVVSANILGLPAAAVPVGIGQDGLPRGVQVLAARFYDGLALEGAAAIEEGVGTFTPIDPRG